MKRLSRADRLTADALVALQPRMRRFAFGLCQSIADADDIVQAAYERALGRLDQYQNGTRLDNWMYSIVRSVALNQIRAASRRRDNIALEFPDDVAQVSFSSPELQHDFRQVAASLAALPTDQREAILLVAVEGLSYREAAKICEVSQAAFTSRLARGRLALAQSTDRSHSSTPRTERKANDN